MRDILRFAPHSGHSDHHSKCLKAVSPLKARQGRKRGGERTGSL